MEIRSRMNSRSGMYPASLYLHLIPFMSELNLELEKIKEMEVPVMSQAINAYYTITA